uniref:Uncharacterized protein n=1 Tax=Anolis carolinensis TaxID=28377 RepID=A0A803TND4_ANOCA
MTFADILDNLGGMGRFQRLMVAFLALPLTMLASHNLLQNFTAGIPVHHCQVRIMANYTRHANNVTKEMGAEGLLRISIPMGKDQKAEKCRRFVTTQWRLLDPNATLPNDTMVDTEPCADGWTYDRSMFPSTIVSEVKPRQRQTQRQFNLLLRGCSILATGGSSCFIIHCDGTSSFQHRK